MFAAWLTNAAYEATKRLCKAINDIDKDAQEHQDVYPGVVNDLNIVFGRSLIEPEFDDFTKGGGMTFPWITFISFKNEWKRKRGHSF